MRAALDCAFSVYLFPAHYVTEKNKAVAWWLPPFNLLFGWTVVGWMVAVTWALLSPKYVADWREMSVPHIGGERPLTSIEHAYFRMESARKYGNKQEYDDCVRAAEKEARKIVDESEGR